MSKTEKSHLIRDVNAPKELLKAQKLANVLDSSVRIPLIGLRVGLDSLIGLIPVVGDAIMLLASSRIIYLGYKMKLPKALINIMIRNSLIDFALGFIPILGDIVDIFFKANIRNVRIMEEYWVAQNKELIDAAAAKKFSDWQRQQGDDNT